jgi:hypothetical protein
MVLASSAAELISYHRRYDRVVPLGGEAGTATIRDEEAFR